MFVSDRDGVYKRTTFFDENGYYYDIMTSVDDIVFTLLFFI